MIGRVPKKGLGVTGAYDHVQITFIEKWNATHTESDLGLGELEAPVELAGVPFGPVAPLLEAGMTLEKEKEGKKISNVTPQEKKEHYRVKCICLGIWPE